MKNITKEYIERLRNDETIVLIVNGKKRWLYNAGLNDEFNVYYVLETEGQSLNDILDIGMLDDFLDSRELVEVKNVNN
jgi:outer membrane lipoprotein-sorting protein